MPNRILRAIYSGLATAHAQLSGRERQPGSPPFRAALAGTACLTASLVGLTSADVAFGCRNNGLVPLLNSRLPASPLIADGVSRLHAAIGAGTMAARMASHPVVLAYFERHEANKAAWSNALVLAAKLPILLIVLPRWKGRETSSDLGRVARAAGLPGIPVDAQDPIALYRVAQESILRARAGGGAALIEAVHLPDGQAATEKLAAYLLRHSVASQAWIDGKHNAAARSSKVSSPRVL